MRHRKAPSGSDAFRRWLWGVLGLCLIYTEGNCIELHARKTIGSQPADPFSFAEISPAVRPVSKEDLLQEASDTETLHPSYAQVSSSQEDASEETQEDQTPSKPISSEKKGDNANQSSYSTTVKTSENQQKTNPQDSRSAANHEAYKGGSTKGTERRYVPESKSTSAPKALESPGRHPQDEIPVEDPLSDLFARDYVMLDPTEAFALKDESDPQLADLEASIFHQGDEREKLSPDMMEASLTLGRLARAFDMGKDAAEKELGDLKLLQSLPEGEIPAALRGLVTLNEEGIVGGYLVRLWQAHKRLGMSLRDAMTSFRTSIEKEKTRSTEIAALMEVYRVRESAKAAGEKRETAEAEAELEVLKREHQYLGKVRRRLRKKLQLATNPDSLSMDLESMWEPVDAVAAFDPARGSGFYNSVRLLKHDLNDVKSTCTKLRALVSRVTQSLSTASPKQLKKEANEEDELRAILNPDVGPLAAISSKSLSVLAQADPKALNAADKEFMKTVSEEDPLTTQIPPDPRRRPRFGPPNIPLAPVQPSLVPPLVINGEMEIGGQGQLQESAIPVGPAEAFYPFSLEHQILHPFFSALTPPPSVVLDSADGLVPHSWGVGSFMELKSEATPVQQPLRHNDHLSPVAPHSNAASGISFLNLGESSEKEDDDDDEAESDKGSKSSSDAESEGGASAKASTVEGQDSAKGSETESKQKDEEESQHQSKQSEGETASPVTNADENGSKSEKQHTAQGGSEVGNMKDTESVKEKEVGGERPHEAPTITMLPELEPNSCESVTDPAQCMQKPNCFQDFIYGACFFNCTTVATAEECEKHKFCRFETHVPHNTCVNEGYQSTNAIVQKFEGIIRGCEHFTRKETCDWMYALGNLQLEKEKEGKKSAGGQIPSIAHRGHSPYHCQWMPGPSNPENEKEVIEVGGSSVCGNIRDAPTAERLLWGTVVAEKEKKLKELKAQEDFGDGDICVRPTDRLAVLNPSRPFYSIGSIVKVSCLPGSVLLGIRDEIECKSDGNFEPALACVEEGDLSEAQLRHLRKRQEILNAAVAPTFGWGIFVAAVIWGGFLHQGM